MADRRVPPHRGPPAVGHREGTHRTTLVAPVRFPLKSVGGIGKRRGWPMLDLWVPRAGSVRTTIVTANTETQLRSRTMAELGKWQVMAINRHWFESPPCPCDPQLVRRARREPTQDGHAVLLRGGAIVVRREPRCVRRGHSQIGMMVQFDEASGIPDPIWQVTEGSSRTWPHCACGWPSATLDATPGASSTASTRTARSGMRSTWTRARSRVWTRPCTSASRTSMARTAM